MTKVVVTLAGEAFTVSIDDNPLGWRWWTRGGLPASDRYEGHRYGQTRCVPLGYIDTPWGGTVLLSAMELDGMLAVSSAHEVFPILDDGVATKGAGEFVRAALQRHATQPDLFG